MSSRDTEGRREIEAAQRRLAAAQAHASAAAKTVATANETKASAQKTLEVASKNADAAETQLLSTEKEVKEAKKFLKEAEKRWEVIEVGSDDEGQENDGSSKRRKVSNDATATGGQVEQVTVEGCGIAEANGIYKRDGVLEGAPEFTKEGDLDGDRVVFEIYRQCGPDYDYWQISAQREKCGDYSHLYFSSSTDRDALLPPANGWEVDNEFGSKGVLLPVPQLKLGYAEISS